MIADAWIEIVHLWLADQKDWQRDIRLYVHEEGAPLTGIDLSVETATKLRDMLSAALREVRQQDWEVYP